MKYEIEEEMKRLGKEIEETVFFATGPDFIANGLIFVRALNIWKSSDGLRAIKRGKYNKKCAKNHHFERWGKEIRTGLTNQDEECLSDIKIIVKSGNSAYVVYYNSKCLVEALKEYNEKTYSLILGENEVRE